ncbi:MULTISPECIES: hypothetical protein [Sphingobium]|jgi:pyruvate carboxylase|uniref:hypothetical protein n=1 Tax=Sphingobium TaxID=165695 RepID=UPI001D18385C|nr:MULTISPECIES: hypothetical protein [Sphingobium]MCC4258951.1 hypothetical protein [Sphingobium lactosutens]|tara:strand:- start:5657 stop:5839 length:183 start_codon:yes stop_codon:yes gene_type:complete
MPVGQFTNLKEQARSLGLASRWHEVACAYREASDLFGDIVKATPSSGDSIEAKDLLLVLE